MTCLYEIHLFFQFPVKIESTQGKRSYLTNVNGFSHRGVGTCTALVCLAVVFSAPLSSQWLAYERSHPQLFQPPHPSHRAHAYAYNPREQTHIVN